MDIKEKCARIAQEYEDYYSAYVPCVQPLMEKLEEIYAAHKDGPSCQLKAKIIRYLCETCEVHLFREVPFFFEMNSGRPRHSWGGLQSPVGAFLHDKTAPLWLLPYGAETQPLRDDGFMFGWNNPIGVDHFCLGYDTILAQGIEGIKARAEAALAAAGTDRQRSFLSAAVDSLDALIAETIILN